MMKKLLALILALVMVLTLAACGKDDPADTTPTGETDPSTEGTTVTTPTTLPNEPKTVDLVTAYETDNGTFMGRNVDPYRMDFVYNSDYRGGTVTLSSKTEDNTLEGTFTCDDNYNINSMEFHEDDTVGNFVMTFDDQHRLLSAETTTTTDGETELHYKALRTYDVFGNNTYSQTYTAGVQTYIAENEYNAKGQLLRQKTTVTTHYEAEPFTYTSITAYEYDENGRMTAILSYDGEENLMSTVEFTCEPEGENFRYTAEMDGSKMVMVMNSQGKSLLTELYNEEGLYNKIETTLNDQGQILTQTQWSIYTEGTTVTTYTYTASGRVSSVILSLDGVETVQMRTTFQTVELPG